MRNSEQLSSTRNRLHILQYFSSPHYEDASWSKGMNPHINFSISFWTMISFMPQLLHSCGRSAWYILHRGLGEFQIQWRLWWKQTSLCLPQISDLLASPPLWLRHPGLSLCICTHLWYTKTDQAVRSSWIWHSVTGLVVPWRVEQYIKNLLLGLPDPWRWNTTFVQNVRNRYHSGCYNIQKDLNPQTHHCEISLQLWNWNSG